ncbi:BnaA05g09960D [Brassica napus]|uniref:BnaA05g09960D protein n=1 Tax=Brassica napus TaxID=3708 RepID=A0A078FWS0_BRANA|nr:BnaA05g09960D [Brassica napus]
MRNRCGAFISDQKWPKPTKPGTFTSISHQASDPICCPHDYPVCDLDHGTCLMSKNSLFSVKALKCQPCTFASS